MDAKKSVSNTAKKMSSMNLKESKSSVASSLIPKPKVESKASKIEPKPVEPKKIGIRRVSRTSLGVKSDLKSKESIPAKPQSARLSTTRVGKNKILI